METRASAYLRSPVLVAKKKSDLCFSIQGPNPQLRIPIAGSRIEVVDPVAHQQFHGTVSFQLGDRTEGSRAEKGSGAQVSCPSKS